MSEICFIWGRQFFLVFLVGMCVINTPSFSLEVNTNRCISQEGEALQSINPACAYYFSRNFHDCCNWPGVYCSKLTGHVDKLLLSDFLDYCEDGMPLDIGIGISHLGPSLLALEDLRYLEITDLGFFPVHGNLSFIGSLTHLRYLSIEFYEIDPLEFDNLALSHSNVFAKSLKTLSRLTSLRYLIIHGVDFSEATDWLHVVNNLPSLEHLVLSYCVLPDSISHPHVSVNSSKSLSFIDLSNNDLQSSMIWTWIFNHSSLVRLSLSNNQISGRVPSRFTDRTSLAHLDVSDNQLEVEGGFFNSMKGLCRLQGLDLSGNNFLKGDLSSIFQSLSCANKSLMFLSLQRNNFTGVVPDFTLFSSLRELNLNSNRLSGSLPCKFKRPLNLVALNLQENQLTGPVPDLSVFRSLRVLQLQNNQLNGSIHAGLGQLSRLKGLDISSNSLEGEISVSHLSNLSSLRDLDLSYNSLSFNVSSTWVPPFRLDYIGLASCSLGSRFPEWLKTQTDYSSLDISYAGISDAIPLWFWNFSSRAIFIDLSHNRLQGDLSKLSTGFGLPAIDLSSNLLEGTIPSFLGNSSYLNLSRNSFSGSISFLCKSPSVMACLDLSHNFFSGNLPDCLSFGMRHFLSVLDLSSNAFSGKLPSSFGSLMKLQSLHLRDNKFSGRLPPSLRNLTNLQYLDLGENLFSGEIPNWIGYVLQNLIGLSLRNNSFSGKIPQELCNISSIQILDLSTNNISGVIPSCLCSFTAMTQAWSSSPSREIHGINVTISFKDHISLVLKGFSYEYKNFLELVKSIDLSSNKLGGEIPAEISCLTGLISLNFSGNNLMGSITTKIGQLKSLESLDLSNNHLSGEIPSTLSNLNFLGTLNLANNNFSGRIPTGTQIQSFNASVFARNPRLCGDPLPKRCIGDDQGKVDGDNDQNKSNPENDDEDISLGLYISIALGFITGFWVVCGVLIFKKSWRYAYFRFWTRIYDRLYVMITLKIVAIQT